LANCNFGSASALESNFDDIKASGVDFSKAAMRRGRFCRSSLEDVKFIDAELEYSDFSGAWVNDVDYTGARLRFANFHAVQGEYELSAPQQSVVLGSDDAKLEAEALHAAAH
jgi:uncharacterized protein YjbI with pentapeptide repeats